MSYSPQNSAVYEAAYSGAFAGMGLSGRLAIFSTSASYNALAAYAGAWAQSFDTVWAGARADSLQLALIQTQSESVWQNRAIATNASVAPYNLPATYTAQVIAIIASIMSAEAYFAGQGIPILPAASEWSTLVYQPGGTNGPGVYTTFAALYAGYLASGYSGPVEIFWDLRFGAIEIPVGSYAFASALRFNGFLDSAADIPTNVHFTFVGTLSFGNGIFTANDTSPFTIVTGSGFVNVVLSGESCLVGAYGSAPMVDYVTLITDALNISSNGVAYVGSFGTSNSVFNISGPGALAVYGNGNADFLDNTFGAPTGAQVTYVISSDAIFSGTQPSILAGSPHITYLGTNGNQITRFKSGTAVLTNGVSGTITCSNSVTTQIFISRKAVNASTALGFISALSSGRTPGLPGTFVATSQTALGATAVGDQSSFDWFAIG